jgi:hypothetical protein
MPSSIRKPAAHRASKRKNSVNRPVPTVPIGIVSVTKATTTMTIVFNQPVTLKGIPQYTTNLAGITPISAALTAPATLSLTFSASVATATTLNIPAEEPAIRNSSGGFVSPSTFPA